MALQDLLGAGIGAYDAQRRIEEERAWQQGQRALQAQALVRQQQAERLKALQAQGEAFLNAGMVKEAAGLVPEASRLQGQVSGVSTPAPSFLGEPAGPGQPNSLNNPRTDAAVRAYLGVEPPKPVAVGFGTSLVDPRTGRALYDGSTQRLEVEQQKNETRMDVAQLNNTTRAGIAEARIRSAEAMLGRRLSQAERALVFRRDADLALEEERQANRLDLEGVRQDGRQELQAQRPANTRTVVIQGHRYNVDAQGNPTQHLGAAAPFNEGAFLRNWGAQNGVMNGMPIPSDKLEAYRQALSTARSNHLRDPLGLQGRPAGQQPARGGGIQRPKSLLEALQMLERMPEGRP